MTRMRFGIVQTPLHSSKINPTLAMRQDLELMQHLDRLGFDEAWIGEHHSGGSEIIGSPEIFIAAAAEVTSRIKFGSGVTSISYHNPLWVADRFVQLDHQTRGRVMLGVGPGSLPSDSSMIGLTPTDTRELLSDNIDIILRLLRGETVTATTKTHTLVDARLQLAPYSEPLFDIVAAGVVSPTGPRLAGMHGLGLFSIGATMTSDGFDALAHAFGIQQERAAEYGKTVSRDQWRLATLFHLAETREQAYKDVAYGIEEWFRYWKDVVAFPQMAVEGENVREMIDFINDNGIGVIGTPDDAVRQIQRLEKQTGGFGALLVFGNDWADRAATFTSYELFARHVIPAFQGHLAAAAASQAHTAAMREEQTKQHLAAISHMTEKYGAEVAAKA
ncbi:MULTISPECIES: LLM class flavin-dependent oxidoreductase [Microbacterium]|uniref:LLM class flavin-dependent oxidoreductase n=1 Tax=Microbacterium TaxID=33882 RepID=UPI00278055F2|nr:MULTISPECIES: LLM class flavin-dependent oxidoreductase [Microbacterium]MDQ1074149.1 limonene 1,2-monooxygenase [Microbacterium sp. SORGH_AS_0969]MDQ1114375.1 limonene 1,2-monooxygenase [Microbacterium testaceum]